MCKIGDIIVVKNYKSQGVNISKHSFVVLSTEQGKIQGLDFDLVCNVMSSFHSEEHRKQKMRYPGNFEYSAEQENVHGGHGKAGFIKAEQFYYFDRNKLDFYVLGNVEPELFNALIAYIQTLDEIEHVVDNL
ncbi:MAG: hypothetical protein IJ427_12905 [Lachnospiraceae bacterium]|nr:hypothetical protein [Lachnospiraceae bacterium]MBQ8549391.1 hypothetical protein [Lachnospiraceae bacterium]MBQ8846585.1 hypothetical protein [Lachnospiraceae bacterium]